MRAALVGLLAAGCASQETAPDPRRMATHLPPAGIEASWIDPTIDPCVDFYRFACGGWLANTPPAREGVITARFLALDERTSQVLRSLLAPAAEGHTVPGLRDGTAAGDLYASCTSPAVQSRGLVEVQAQLAPLREVTSPAGVGEAVVRLEARGVPALLSFIAMPDPTGGPVAVALLSLHVVGLRPLDPRDPRAAQIREGVRAEVQETFARGGLSPDAARTSADRVMALELALAAADPGRAGRRDPRRAESPVTLEALRAQAPSFPWRAWAHAAGLPDDARFGGLRPVALAALETQLRSASVETWRAALHFSVLRALGPALPAAGNRVPRWRTCVEVVSEGLPDAVEAAFVQRVLTAEDAAAVRLLLGNLEEAFSTRLDALAWMDAATRAAVRAKLGRLVNRVGGPERWPDTAAPQLSRESLAANLLALARFELAGEAVQVGRPVDRSLWPESVLTANAYYDPSRNEILVPAGLLQPPIFSRNYAPAVNLGLLGTVLGHEIIHGFDRNGRWRDGAGVVRGGWSPASVAAFDGRAACLQAQADATPVLAGMKVNGAATLDEDLADLGGLRLALLALESGRRGRPVPTGGDLSDAQALFLGWGQLWCTKASASAAGALLSLDSHAPHPVRVNAPLRNLAEFAQAFGCRADAPMVARPRCEVW